ncbi:MAG: hypothetical protein AAF335_00475 [Bacteroidota bacterium]
MRRKPLSRIFFFYLIAGASFMSTQASLLPSLRKPTLFAKGVTSFLLVTCLKLLSYDSVQNMYNHVNEEEKFCPYTPPENDFFEDLAIEYDNKHMVTCRFEEPNDQKRYAVDKKEKPQRYEALLDSLGNCMCFNPYALFYLFEKKDQVVCCKSSGVSLELVDRGKPFVTYYNVDLELLRVVFCSNAACTDFQVVNSSIADTRASSEDGAFDNFEEDHTYHSWRP